MAELENACRMEMLPSENCRAHFVVERDLFLAADPRGTCSGFLADGTPIQHIPTGVAITDIASRCYEVICKRSGVVGLYSEYDRLMARHKLGKVGAISISSMEQFRDNLLCSWTNSTLMLPCGPRFDGIDRCLVRLSVRSFQQYGLYNLSLMQRIWEDALNSSETSWSSSSLHSAVIEQSFVAEDCRSDMKSSVVDVKSVLAFLDCSLLRHQEPKATVDYFLGNRRLQVHGSLGHHVRTCRDHVCHIVKLAGIMAEDTVLDIGCGDGSFLIDILNAVLGCHAFGVDIDASLIAEARDAIVQHGLTGRVNLFRMAGEDIIDFIHLFRDVTLIYLYALNISSNKGLMEVLQRLSYGREGIRILTHQFELHYDFLTLIGQWPDPDDLAESFLEIWPDDSPTYFYLYEAKALRMNRRLLNIGARLLLSESVQMTIET